MDFLRGSFWTWWSSDIPYRQHRGIIRVILKKRRYESAPWATKCWQGPLRFGFQGFIWRRTEVLCREKWLARVYKELRTHDFLPRVFLTVSPGLSRSSLASRLRIYLSQKINLFTNELIQQTLTEFLHYILGTVLATGITVSNRRESTSQGSYHSGKGNRQLSRQLAYTLVMARQRGTRRLREQ